MKIAALALALMSTGSNAAVATNKIGETCNGTETVQVGTQAPKVVPYSLTFSADLTAKSYCYGGCGPDQTYPISDSTSNPIKLADLNADDEQVGSQTRRITFDRRSGTLTDVQFMNLGAFGKAVRHATARCRASAFTQPAPIPSLKRR